MRQGHRRLEVDKRFTFALSVKGGGNISMTITPSALNEATKKGLVIKNNSQYSELSFLSGNIANWKMGGEINLQKVVDGELVPIASFSTSKTNKRFQFAVPVKQDGFYYVTSLRFRSRIYLKAADPLELNLNAMSGELEVINGSEENRLLEKWQKLFFPATQYGYNISVFQCDTIDLENYLTNYQKLQAPINDFKLQNRSSNIQFNRLFDLAIDLDREYAPMYLLSCLSRRNGNRKNSSFILDNSSLYKQFIQPSKFKDLDILRIGEAMQYINLYQKLNLASLSQNGGNDLSGADKLKVMMDAFANDTLKAIFLKSQLETASVNNLTEFRATFQPFEKYTFLPETKRRYMSVYESFMPDTAYLGKSSYNFSLPDSTGRMISMKDFAGKVIFIDVWATWCGPCKGQFPFLKEIEEEYSDNDNIVFVAISLDRENDRQKWLNTIKKENLKGIHLLDDKGKSFGKKYDVMSIPRFMLINKKGEWIEVRCPLPEAKKELKKYLDEALNQDVSIAN
jgi:thiol-disulfide isomerase/thioredoxin